MPLVTSNKSQSKVNYPGTDFLVFASFNLDSHSFFGDKRTVPFKVQLLGKVDKRKLFELVKFWFLLVYLGMRATTQSYFILPFNVLDVVV